ncbi:MAG: hypothetical protein QXU52_01050 [Fervidicoccaceae archaeon]
MKQQRGRFASLDSVRAAEVLGRAISAASALSGSRGPHSPELLENATVT